MADDLVSRNQRRKSADRSAVERARRAKLGRLLKAQRQGIPPPPPCRGELSEGGKLMKILICGDRNWTNPEPMRTLMSAFSLDITIIEGEARGADSMARNIAWELGLSVDPFPANWKKYGRGAGPIRNKQMLEAEPDLVLAFHSNLEESKGTANMVKIAREAKIPVVVIGE